MKRYFGILLALVLVVGSLSASAETGSTLETVGDDAFRIITDVPDSGNHPDTYGVDILAAGTWTFQVIEWGTADEVWVGKVATNPVAVVQMCANNIAKLATRDWSVVDNGRCWAKNYFVYLPLTMRNWIPPVLTIPTATQTAMPTATDVPPTETSVPPTATATPTVSATPSLTVTVTQAVTNTPTVEPTASATAIPSPTVEPTATSAPVLEEIGCNESWLTGYRDPAVSPWGMLEPGTAIIVTMDPGSVEVADAGITGYLDGGMTVAIYNQSDHDIMVVIRTGWNPESGHPNFNACKYRGTVEQVFDRADAIQAEAHKALFSKFTYPILQ